MIETFIVLLINLLLYIYFISCQIEDRSKKIYALCQFGLMIPLVIQIADLVYTNNIIYGWLIVFFIPILSLYLLIDSLIYG
jgi:hypothetical protein